METLKIGDKVYSKILGPSSTGIITNIESDNNIPFITVKLDKPIKNIAGYSEYFFKVN